LEVEERMSDTLSRKLCWLDDFLRSDAVGDEAMLLSELDGFLAGLIVCPDMIMPSEWMPFVWGDDDGPIFDSMVQVETISGLIMGHYNDIIRGLDRSQHRPIYDVDIDGTFLWEIWIEGFGQAMRLRPEAWQVYAHDDDADLQRAMFVLGRLNELATLRPQDITRLAIDEELEKLAPELIPAHVEVLHQARLARAKPGSFAANENRPKVGRNEPCPCGSGKKFKKCCMN
jgi:uncharacterized protein